MPTVKDVFYDALRHHNVRKIFGNPGSTEEGMLDELPSDFEYVLALQEASAITMADGYAQLSRKPCIVSLHSTIGTGNAMGNLVSAYLSHTPLIIIAGQQRREMLLHEAMLTNPEPTLLVKPYVKWAYQPARAQDVPGAVVRAINMAVQPPQGPVFLSVPLDDWVQPYDGTALENFSITQTISTRQAPDPHRLAGFVNTIQSAKNPAILYGAGVARSQACEAAVAFAERINAAVFIDPLLERNAFPVTHPLFRQILPGAKGLNSKTLAEFDVVVVIGATAFRYYPYVPGNFAPEGTQVLQITDDGYDAACSAVGDSLLGDPGLALEALNKAIPHKGASYSDSWRTLPPPVTETGELGERLTPLQAFASVARLRPPHSIVVNESASNFGAFFNSWPFIEPNSYFFLSGGGLGWGMPAAVGLAAAERDAQGSRPVFAFLGDGGAQFSIQSLWTAAQLKLKVLFVIINNESYAILRQFATTQGYKDVPALDLPGLDIVKIAEGYGLPGAKACTPDEILKAVQDALGRDGPSLIEIVVEKPTGGVGLN